MSPSEFVPPRRVLAEKAIRQRVSLAIRELDCIKADVESGKCGYHAVRARLLHLHGYLNDRREGYGVDVAGISTTLNILCHGFVMVGLAVTEMIGDTARQKEFTSHAKVHAGLNNIKV